MFEFPLLEVIQAIEELRESRGTTNQQICDFVRQQGRNPNDPMKILKTIRTLNKLVEEGVLIKKGKRYVFPTKPPEFKEDEEEEKQEDDCGGEQGQELEPDSCDEENEDDEDEEDEEEEGKDEGGEEGAQEEQPEEEEEDDDDDDDDDDDEDDDDDDDDDDEQCNDKDVVLEPKADPCAEGGTAKGLGQQKSALNSGEPKATDNVTDNDERIDKIASNISENMGTKKSGRKNGKGQNSYETKTSNKGKNKGGEAIAFCARDFIDSQCSQNNSSAKPVAQHEKPQDDLIEIENFDNSSVGRIFGIRKRESKSRKSRAENDCRSRSPIRGYVKNGYFTDLKLNHSEELRKNMIRSQIFQEVTDTPMDVDNDNEVVDLDYDILRQRSPIGPPSTINPGVHLDRRESCCSQPTNKSPETTKAEMDFDCKNQYFLKKNSEFKRSRHSMARAIDMQNKRLAAKEAAEKDKEKHKRDLCSEEGNDIKTEKGASLCSVCEKKKRNS